MPSSHPLAVEMLSVIWTDPGGRVTVDKAYWQSVFRELWNVNFPWDHSELLDLMTPGDSPFPKLSPPLAPMVFSYKLSMENPRVGWCQKPWSSSVQTPLLKKNPFSGIQFEGLIPAMAVQSGFTQKGWPIWMSITRKINYEAERLTCLV